MSDLVVVDVTVTTSGGTSTPAPSGAFRYIDPAQQVDPTLGMGTVIEVDRGSGYEPIVKLAEIGEIGAEIDDIEITVHGDACRRYMPGYVTVLSIGFSGLWVAHPSQVALLEDALSRNWDDETVDVTVIGPGGTSVPTADDEFVYSSIVLPYRVSLAQGLGDFEFDGYIGSFAIDPRLDEALWCSGQLRVSGQLGLGIGGGYGIGAYGVAPYGA